MIRILIADDHAIVRSGLKQIFATTLDICVVGEATRGEDIPEQLKDRQVDLLLLDMAMPGLAGIELIRTLRMQQGEIPILVLSMHNEGADRGPGAEGRRRRLRHQGQRTGSAARGHTQGSQRRKVHRPGPEGRDEQ